MKTLTTVVLLFLTLPLIGCGTKNPFGTVPVSGVVRLDGKPVSEVTVALIPVSSDTIGAVGLTQPDGSFVLTTGGSEFGGGAQPGQYHITFSKTDVEDKYKNPSPDQAASAPQFVPRRYIVPQRYENKETSGIEPITVQKKDKNHFEFDLKTE